MKRWFMAGSQSGDYEERIDGPESKSLGFDNMQNRPIKGTTDWQEIPGCPECASGKRPCCLRHSIDRKGTGLAQ